MGFVKEFKEFAIRGNVMDLAIGVIIGGAFGKIVSSVVDDVLSPIIGMLVGSSLKDAMKIVLRPALDEKTPEVAIKIGSLLQTTIDFLIIALFVFMIVKAMNAAKKKEADAPPPPPPAQEVLLGEIRDLLKKGR